ncbi:Histone-fold [Penicillium riverlandense]|uniref:Histone-fold n=1 Tax=Penicillium riverlandense TaxID=1903569 RepID=UPI00254879E3|nr:Histone-fold [Penicillium riverlandense]KAJ5832253.1 Histone-fold [Penicillium riverlandense]
MPPRKSTSSVTPADPDESTQLSPTQHPEKNITATEQQLKARAELGVSVEDYLLPRSLTIRLAKAALPPNTTIQKDAVLAIQKAATVFVSYLSSHANESTLKRTVAPADVLAALSELEFDSFRPRLEQELEAYTQSKADKRKPKKAEGEEGPAEPAATSTETGAAGAALVGDDGDVEMEDNPAKRVKRDEGGVVAGQDVDEDETQEEELEDEDDEEEEEEEHEDEEDDEGEEQAEGRGHENDIDHVEDLDRDPRQRGMMDPDADETDEDDGPASQLRDNMGLG